MALIHCEQCGKQVSDQAIACPNCGNPIASRLMHNQAPIYVAPQETVGKQVGRSIRTIVGWVIGVFIILLVIGIVKGCYSAVNNDTSTKQNAVAPPPPPPPTAIFDVSASSSTEECTELGDYCIRVYCTYYNKGDGPGKKDIGAQLMDNDVLVTTKASTLTLLPAENQKIYFDFKEAELGDEHHYTYRCLADN